jgi:hypothetical protein
MSFNGRLVNNGVPLGDTRGIRTSIPTKSISCHPPGYPISKHLDSYSSKHSFFNFFMLRVWVDHHSALDPSFTAFNYGVPNKGLMRTTYVSSYSWQNSQLTLHLRLRSTKVAARSSIYFEYSNTCTARGVHDPSFHIYNPSHTVADNQSSTNTPMCKVFSSPFVRIGISHTIQT